MKLKSFLRKISYLFAIACVFPAHAGAYDDFFRAVEVDDARAVTGLLERGFDPNAVNEQGQVGLYLALRGGSRKVAQVLLASPQVRIDHANGADETPLMMAALRDDLAAARQLVARGAHINRKGWTPLHYAASSPGAEVVRFLVGEGAELEARSPNGTTALMMAARYGTEEAALYLMAQGADRKRRNDLGLDAADFARLAGRESLALRIKGS